MHGRGDMDVTMSTTMLNCERRTCVSLLERAVFVTRSMLGLTNGGWRDGDVRGREVKEEGKGEDKSIDAGLERPCCCIV